MRFDLPESIEAMRAGAKTQTRRRSAYWLKKQPGDRITVVHQGVNLGWTRVVMVRDQWLTYITLAEAHAEGYESREQFFAAWRDLYGEHRMASFVTVIEFEPVRWRDG